MNKKGFTLIEILAIVVLIGVIAVIAIPNITKQADEQSTKQTNLLKEQITNAAKIAASSSVRVDDDGKITDNTSTKSNIEKLIECKDKSIETTCMEILIYSADTSKYSLVGSELLSLTDSELDNFQDKEVIVKKQKETIKKEDGTEEEKEIIKYVLPE